MSRYRQSYCEYEANNETNFRNLMRLGLLDIRFAEYAANMLDGRRFLDIGCAIGVMIDEMTRAGWQAVGIDICAESLAYGRKKFGVNLCRAEAIPAPLTPGSFDAIHSSHVIEHVLRPDLWMHAIHHLLKPGGVCILTTPNTQSVQAWYAGRRWRSYIADHLQLFGKRNLHLLLRRTGFDIIRQISWGGIPAGNAGLFAKTVADRLAKKINMGDVMLFFARKSRRQMSAGLP